MKYTLKVIGFCLAMGLGSQSHAYDKNGKYIALGVANESCGEYISYRGKGSDNAYREFTSGYLSYVNINTPDTYDIRGGRHMDALLLWIDNYCNTNPLDRFSDGVVALEHELRKIKQSEKP